jgi:hypothetical protein
MEACSGTYFIARQLTALGHDVHLIPAQYVKPFLKGHKNDYRDAEAIAEAVQQPTMPLCIDQDAGADGFAITAPCALALGQTAYGFGQSNPRLSARARHHRCGKASCRCEKHCLKF